MIILEENIQPGADSNFQKKNSTTYSTRGTPFDTNSVLMFGPQDFGLLDSSTGQRKATILPTKPGLEFR